MSAVMQDVPVHDVKTGELLPDEVWTGVAANDNRPARQAQRTTCCPTPAIRRSSLVGRPLGNIVSIDSPASPAREAQRRADLAGRHLAAANDNAPAPPERAPWLEEAAAGRLGGPLEAAFRIDTGAWIHNAWHEFDAAWFTPGTGWRTGDGASSPLGGDPLKLRGAECRANAAQLWTRLHRRAGGLFWPVHQAVIERAEMKELAPAGTPIKQRAKAGRAVLCEGLDRVGIEKNFIDWFERYGSAPPE